MKRLLLFAVCAITLICSAEDKYLQLVDKADKAIAEEDWGKAQQFLQEAMRSDPSNPGNIMLLSNLGMIQYYQGLDSLAVATLTDAHRIAPRATVILANRARIYTANGALDLAIADYNDIEQIDSLAWQPYLYRGLIYLSQGKVDSAEKDLIKLESLRPDAEDTHIALAALFSTKEQPEMALPHFNYIIEHDPQASYYAGRAMCFIQKEYYMDAAEDIAAGLELDNTYAELYVCRALLNQRRYLRDDALRDAQTAISLGADPSRIKIILGI